MSARSERTPAPKRSAAESKARLSRFFGLGDKNIRFVPIRADLFDMAMAAEVADGALMTLQLLYLLGTDAVLSADDEAAEQVVTTSLAELADRRRLTVTTMRRHLRELTDKGFANVAISHTGRLTVILPSYPALLDDLFSRAEVLQALRGARPELFDSVGKPRGPWAEARSRAGFAEAATAEGELAAHLLEYLEEKLTHGWRSPFRFDKDEQNVAAVLATVEAYGLEPTYAIFDRVATPASWEALTASAGVVAETPTPAMLRDFAPLLLSPSDKNVRWVHEGESGSPGEF